MAEPASLAESVDVEPQHGPGEFADIVRREQSMVFSLALHFLRDRQAAEEVAQDVFLQLHRNLSTMASADHVRFWLRKVTGHRCIDYTRRRKTRQVALDDVAELGAEGSQRDPMLARRLKDLVATLPERARMVVILRYQEDLTPLEIADTLAIPVATVKSHLQRSLALLREKALRVIGDMRT